MKKQYKKLVMAGIIVVCLAVASLILTALLDIDLFEKKKTYVIKGQADQMFAVRVTIPKDRWDGQESYRYVVGKMLNEDGESLTYIFQDGGVRDTFDYSQSLLSDAFTRIMALEATEVVYANAQELEGVDLAAYGLTPERAVEVTVVPWDNLLEDGATDEEGNKIEKLSPITLLIGDYNDVEKEYYCKRTDTDAVYMISAYNANTYLTGATRYRSTDILPDLGTYYDKVRSITLTNAAGEEIVMVRNESLVSQVEGETIFSLFRMESPFVCYVDDTILADEMTSKLDEISVMQVVEDFPKDLSVYGLDKNYGTLHFAMMDGSEKILHFSQSNGTCYIRVEGIDSVYLAMGETGFINLGPMDLRSELVWLHEIKEVDRVLIRTPNGEHVLQVDDTVDAQAQTGTFVAALDGAAVSEENGRQLYASVISVAYDNIVVGAPEETTPSYTFTVVYKSGFTETVNFYRVTSRQYAVTFNGEEPSAESFCANVTTLRRVMENIETIKSGGTISQY